MRGDRSCSSIAAVARVNSSSICDLYDSLFDCHHAQAIAARATSSTITPVTRCPELGSTTLY